MKLPNLIQTQKRKLRAEQTWIGKIKENPAVDWKMETWNSNNSSNQNDYFETLSYSKPNWCGKMEESIKWINKLEQAKSENRENWRKEQIWKCGEEKRKKGREVRLRLATIFSGDLRKYGGVELS